MPEELSIFAEANARSRRRKILAGSLVVLVLTLLILRLLWGTIAAHRLDSALAAVRATGDPLTLEALYPPTDPDLRNNAVPLLLQAMSAMSTTVDSPQNSNLDYKYYPPFPPAWHQLASAAVAANTQSLKFARDARAFPKFYWNVPITTPMVPPLGSLNQSRALANFLADAAQYTQLHGDDLEAVERIRDVLHLGQAVDHQNSLVAHLVTVGINALATGRLQVMSPSFKIPPGDEQSPLRKDLRLLIAELLDDKDAVESFHRAIAAERVYQIDYTGFFLRGVWVVRPAYNLDLARLLHSDDLTLEASHQPSFVIAKKLFGAQWTDQPPQFVGKFTSFERNPPRFSRSLGAIAYVASLRVLESDVRQRMDQHLLAVSLAIQLYRADHQNHWPATLDALVPDYLQKVPSDPFGPPGATIHYLLLKHALPDGRDRPIIYSVGPNGIDDTAAGHPIPAEPSFGWNFYRGSGPDDQFCDLERWAPPPPPSPATTQSNTSTP